MQTSLRRMGNSTGMILPKAVLRQIGVDVGAAMELVVDGDRVIISPVVTAQRSGWDTAAAEIAAAKDAEADIWLGVTNEDDADLQW